VVSKKTARILIIAIIVNLSFIVLYIHINPTLAAPDEPADIQNKQETLAPNEQWEMIQKRQEELNAKEVQLKELEMQVDEKIKRLEELEASIKKEVEAYKIESDARVRHLVKIYSSIKPKAAASLMDRLDINVAVEVFINMKGDAAGAILSYMETKKAATISRMLATYKGSLN